jgi:hypothetical protein
MTTPSRRLAALAAVALACAACSKLPPVSSAATTVAPTTTVLGASTPAQTKAANYRAQLTYLLVEHVFLLGRVTADVIANPSEASASATAPSSTAASSTSSSSPGATASPVQTTDDSGAALDQNSHDIADLLSQPQGYGSGFDSSFYALWTARIADVAAYASAKSTKFTAAATNATNALAKNATDLSTLVHDTNKYIAVNTVTTTGLDDELTTDNSAVAAFVDAQASNATGAVGLIVTAAESFRHTADLLADAAHQFISDQYPGTPTGTAANLRASVTSALVEHVELAGLTIDQLAKGAAGGPERAALDASSVQLDNIVTANFGDPPARAFAALWGSYVSSLEAAARAKSGRGPAPDLSGVGAQVGNFFGQQATQLSASTITADMQKVVDALTAYIGAVSSGAQPALQLRVAAGAVPKLASDLAEGIAEYVNTVKPGQYLA